MASKQPAYQRAGGRRELSAASPTGFNHAAGLFAAVAVAFASAAITVVAAFAALGALPPHSAPWLLGFGYLVGALYALADGLGPHTRILRAARMAEMLTYKESLGDLNTGKVWLERIATAPLVPLAMVRLTTLQVPAWLALTLAAAGWLSFDVLAVVIRPARREFHRVVRSNPRSSTRDVP